MFYGWTGTELDIDLSTGRVERRPVDVELCRKYLGGRGMGSWLAWDRIPPETDPFSSDNLLIINSGTLNGTICPGANRTSITTKSPLTLIETYCTLGGHFGPVMKFAGYDTIVVSGKSDQPVYVWINDDTVEIRDARHLWGKDTFETQRLIRQELDCPDVQTICIGPAGENRALCASIEHGTGASASRAAPGAVMGDKRLKAIAVRGSKDVNIARPEKFGELCDRMLAAGIKQKEWVDDISHNQIANLARYYLLGNMEGDFLAAEVGDDHAAFLNRYRTKRPGCFNCQISCKQSVRLDGTGVSHGKCGAHLSYWAAFKLADFRDNFRCYELVERMGMDTFSAAAIGAFAIDLYQRGIISKADTDGLHLEYGNVDVALTLIEKIAKREGIGDILADGAVGAAKRIGKGAEELAYHVKRLEVVRIPHQYPYFAFTSALADRPDMTRLISFVPQHLFNKTDEFREYYRHSPYWPYPNEWSKYAIDPVDKTGGDWERMSKMMSWDRDEINAADCTGLCTFWTDFWTYSPIKGAQHAELIAYATGMDVDEEEMMTMGARSGALLRAYNAILGVRRADDTVPEKFFREAAGPRFPALNRANFNKLVDEYYKLRGWNADGIPTKESLAGLGLAFVAEELERRGLYKESGVIEGVKA